MKQHVRLVVLEHLRDEFHVHILDVDLLVLAVISLRHEGRKKSRTWRLLFIIMTDSLSFSCDLVSCTSLAFKAWEERGVRCC